MTSKISKELRTEIKMYQANSWEIFEETPEYVELRRNTSTGGGHLLVLLITFWFTLGIGNLIYYFMKKEKKKLMK